MRRVWSKKKEIVRMIQSGLFCLWFLFSFFASLNADSSALEKALIRSLVMEEKNIGIFQEVLDNISGSIDKIILNTDLNEENLASVLRYGVEYCPPNLDGWSYCMYEKNRETLEKNIDLAYPDTCTNIMREYPYREWKMMSGVTRRFIEDCVEKRLKVAVFFAERTEFEIPIDFITNKFRRWLILDSVFKKAVNFVKK